MKCANRYFRGIAAMKCVSERVSEHYRAIFAQKCVQIRVPLPQFRADSNPHTSCVNHRVVVDA
eukprot:7376276-Lingulodinium_polyedra.AAC.1